MARGPCILINYMIFQFTSILDFDRQESIEPIRSDNLPGTHKGVFVKDYVWRDNKGLFSDMNRCDKCITLELPNDRFIGNLEPVQT